VRYCGKKLMEKEYLALYRKWRSQQFSEIIGQEHICRTLQNVLKDRRLLFHAYLFCGPRGTGKTSLARIFAKTLNCLNNESTPEEPCNRCRNCLKITDGSSLDVMEIDAASNTSVEMVREHIIDKINFAPVETDTPEEHAIGHPKKKKNFYKVYIIDEVHKLSNQSFNALLKTLEEPPSHVVFILATTHPHELLPTILSRCQRYDFRRIMQADIIKHLRVIAQQEGYMVEEGALGILAQSAEGALRDALVFLEQAISYSEGMVTTENVVSLLGLTEESVLFNFSQLIGEGKTSPVLHLVDEIMREGKDILQLTKDLIEHFRRMLLVKVCKDAHPMLEVTIDVFERLKINAGLYEPGDLIRIIKVLSDLVVELKESVNERVILEIALLKMASKKLDPSLAALKQRLDSLEKRIFEKKIEESEVKERVPHDKGEDKLEVKENPPTEGDVRKQEAEQHPVAGEQALWEVWPKILHAIKSEKMPLYAVLVDTKPRMAGQDRIVIEVKKGFTFHKEQVENNRTLIGTIVSQFLHRPMTVQVGLTEETDAQEELFKVDYDEDHRRFVKDAMNIFGGRIV
jgi:DNA polymerase III subunit gamma/tau